MSDDNDTPQRDGLDDEPAETTIDSDASAQPLTDAPDSGNDTASKKSTKGATARSWLVDFLVGGLIAVVVVLGVNWWNDRGDDDNAAPITTPTSPAATLPQPPTNTTAPLDPTKTYSATFETSQGEIVIELDTVNAPIASGQFIRLANAGFYDGLTFHRVVDGFMIQGGDPNGDGTGGSGAAVPGEPPTDNYPIGSLAAAKSMSDPAGTFDSQFFIVTGDQGTSLPNDYARFGRVVSGIEVAQAIAALQTPGSETPSETVQIVKVSIAEA